jgi:hypothetical protein
MLVTQFSASLPDEPSPFVARDNILDTIDVILSGQITAVVVSGPDDIGKTTLLSHYAKRHASGCISLFLTSQKMSYEINRVISDLVVQCRVALGDEPAIEKTGNYVELATLVHRLGLRNRRSVLRFIVDGLAEVAELDSSAVKEVLDLLPFGLPGFRFVLSGPIDAFLVGRHMQTQTFPVTLMSLDECAPILAGLPINSSDVASIHRSCNGMPGQIAAVRRLIQDGMSVQEILEKQPGRLASTMKMEWDRAERRSPDALSALAVLAFDVRAHHIASLSEALAIAPSTLEERLRAIPFVSISSVEKSVAFLSDTFLRYAQKRLESLRRNTYDKLVERYLARDDSESLTAIPYLLTESQRYETLLEILQPAYLERVISATQSLAPISEQASLAVGAALDTERDVELFQFSLIRSVVLQLLKTSNKEDEIAALVATGQRDEALALARAAVLREEKLQLMAAAIEEIAVVDGTIEPSTEEELRQLCRSVDVSVLGESVLDVATSLFTTIPDAAIQLVEAYGNSTGKAHGLDWVLAKISMASNLRSSVRRNANTTETATVYESIADPKLRALSIGMGRIARNTSAEWILEKAKDVEDPADRLTVLRLWLELNARAGDAITVVQAALDLAIRTPTYSLTIGILRQFAVPLPHAVDEEQAKKLVGAIDAQLQGNKFRSPSVEFTRLQLLLGRAELKWSPTAALNRLTELYYFVSQLSDVATKAECLARVFVRIDELDPASNHDDVRTELFRLVTEVARNSAEHDDALLPTMTALVRELPRMAFAMVDEVNTDFRRNLVRRDLVEWWAGSEDFKEVDLVINEIKKIDDPLVHWQAVLSALRGISRRPGRSDIARRFVQLAADIPDAAYRAGCQLNLLISVSKDNGFDEDRHQQLLKALSSIEPANSRIGNCLGAATAIARFDKAKGLSLLEQARDLRHGQPLVEAAVEPFKMCLRLAARALRACIAGQPSSSELQQVLDLMNGIESPTHRAQLASELCLWLVQRGDTTAADAVYERILRAALINAKATDIRGYWRALQTAGPVLFARNQAALLADIRTLPNFQREEVVRRIARSIIDGVGATEPIERSPRPNRLLTLEDARALEVLLGEVDDDWVVFDSIRAVVRSAVSREKPWPREQKADVRLRFESIVVDRLPIKSKIQHEGYRLACAAWVMRLEEAKESEWRRLMKEACLIENVPDSAYTLALIADAMPSRESALRAEVIKRALERGREVSIGVERISILLNIADECSGFSSSVAEAAVREAAKVAAGIEGGIDEEVEDRVLDLAYRINPELSLALASELDADEGKRKARSDHEGRSKRVAEARKQMLEERSSKIAVKDEAAFGTAAWRNLSSLNAGTVGAKRIDAMRPLLSAAAGIPLERSFPLYAWVVQNAVDRLGGSRDGLPFLRRLTQAAVLSAELTRGVSRVSARGIEAAVSGLGNQRKPAPTIISAGDRQKAIGVIRDWCRKALGPYLKISDPYFGPAEMDFIALVREERSDCQISVLTSKKHLRQLGLAQDWEEAFSSSWRAISRESPPTMEIVVADVYPTSRSPIHDRWWITEGSALDLGTSLNSLGVAQDVEVVERDATAAAGLEAQLDQYLTRSSRWLEGAKVSYTVISI